MAASKGAQAQKLSLDRAKVHAILRHAHVARQEPKNGRHTAPAADARPCSRDVLVRSRCSSARDVLSGSLLAFPCPGKRPACD